MSDKISIKHYEIEEFINFLLKLNLRGRNSRMRTRFIKMLEEKKLEVNTEKRQLVSEYAKLGDNGEPIIVQDHTGERIIEFKSDNDRDEFLNEIQILLNEEFVIPINELNQEMIDTVRESVLDCDLLFSGDEAIKYDRYCDIVEGM